MGKIKYLHIMIDSIYTKDYIDKINKLYNQKEHFFVIHQWDGKREYKISKGIVVKNIGILMILKLVYWTLLSEKVILHSLYLNQSMHFAFAILSCIKKIKFSWYIWSADLYDEHARELEIKGLALKKRIKKWMREIIIYHLKYIIVVAEGDYIQTKKWYKTNAIMIQAEYAYNLIRNEYKKEQDNTIYILAGHNAARKGKHIKLFERLSIFSQENIRIISILAYPNDDQKYINDVIEKGNKLFGNKFMPIMDWMSYTKYIRLLESIDIAVFEGTVQMGAGNIYNLIHLGKKVYMDPGNSNYQQLLKKGIICYSISEINKDSFFKELTDKEKSNNLKKMEEICSDKEFKRKWDKLFC